MWYGFSSIRSCIAANSWLNWLLDRRIFFLASFASILPPFATSKALKISPLSFCMGCGSLFVWSCLISRAWISWFSTRWACIAAIAAFSSCNLTIVAARSEMRSCKGWRAFSKSARLAHSVLLLDLPKDFLQLHYSPLKIPDIIKCCIIFCIYFFTKSVHLKSPPQAHALRPATLEGYREGSLLAQAAGSTSWNAYIASQGDISQLGMNKRAPLLHNSSPSFC